MVSCIIGKSVMAVTGSKAQETVGALQLCARHPVGVESAIHAMRSFISDDDSYGILLIDADNAFNRINRSAALWNIQYTCPSMKHITINNYCNDNIKDIYDRVEGKITKGAALLVSNLDLSIFSRNLDIYFLILPTSSITPTTSLHQCSGSIRECFFLGQADKKRVALVLLHRDHVDLFAIQTSSGYQTLFVCR